MTCLLCFVLWWEPQFFCRALPVYAQELQSLPVLDSAKLQQKLQEPGPT